MMKTQQQDVGEQLQAAVMQAALDEAMSNEVKSSLRLSNDQKRIGEGRPGPGRPKGGSNRVTKTIRDAVEAASQPGACHPEGLAGWLIERANGALGDRQIFAAMVSKAMPLQVQANVDGGIRLELGWLGGRSIGTTAAQPAEVITQVVDLERDSAGKYRMIDQKAAPAGGADGGGGQAAVGAGHGAAAAEPGAARPSSPAEQRGLGGAQGE